MQAGLSWKRFRRRLQYWLDHSGRNRLLWEEMEFHIESMIDELVAQGMSKTEARAAAHRKFGNMTQKSEEARSTWIARWMSDLIAGPTPFVSRHAARCRIYGVYNSHRRPRHRSQFHRLQCGQCAAPAPAPVSRSRTAGMDFQRQRLRRHPSRTLFGPPGVEPIILRSGGLVRILPRGRQRTDGNRRTRASHQRSRDRELVRACWVSNPQSEDRSPPRSARGSIPLRLPCC